MLATPMFVHLSVVFRILIYKRRDLFVVYRILNCMAARAVPSRLAGSRSISAILLDITGVLYESGEGDGKAIQGSQEAVSRSEVQTVTAFFPAKLILAYSSAWRIKQ